MSRNPDLQDLDAQILAAEMAVISRDARLRYNIHHMVDGVRQHTARSAAIGAAVALASMFVSRGVSSIAAPGRMAGTAGAARGHGLPWGRIVGLLWPLLPMTMRTRVSPGTAALVASLGIPLAMKAFSRPPPPETATHVDLSRYAGQWYELARLPERSARGATDCSAVYVARGGRRLDVSNRCIDRGGRERIADGHVRVLRGSSGSKMQVSFAPGWLRWLPWSWADYWVLHVDANYEHAVVGTPDYKRLWLLSRRPHADAEQLGSLRALAESRGYETEDLEPTPQRPV